MLILQMHRFRSFLTIAFLFLATAISSSAQEKPKPMIPGPSVKELVPKFPNPNQDGVNRIIFALLFKPGPTEYAHIGVGALKNAPPFPTGYTLFKDGVYEVKTKAIVTTFNVTVFGVPSAESEEEFKSLTILHLEADEMSPSGQSWKEVTLFPQTADEKIFHFISKDKYDSLQPDFKSKRIAGVTNDFGVFALSLRPDSSSESTGPFTQLEISATSSPEPVRAGDEITHTILVKNGGLKTATVNLKEELSPEVEYISVASNQGTCKSSNQSDGRVLCYLGAIPAGAAATVTIVARVSRRLFWTANENSIASINILEVIFKENQTDFAVAENRILTQFSTTIIKGRSSN